MTDDFLKEVGVNVVSGFILICILIILVCLVIYFIKIKVEIAINSNDILNILNSKFSI